MKRLIGKDNIHKWNPSILSFDRLSYGDVIVIERIKYIGTEKERAYIYLPEKITSKILGTAEGDLFVTYKPDLNFPVKYWNSYQFKDKYPYHINNYAKIVKYITHVKEWNDIKKVNDIEKIFDKYDLDKYIVKVI